MLGPDPDAVGVDYAIGEGSGPAAASVVGSCGRGCCGRGAGSPRSPTYFAAPDHRNAASLRMLGKLGFTEGLWFDGPRADGSADTVVGCSLDVRRCWPDAP